MGIGWLLIRSVLNTNVNEVGKYNYCEFNSIHMEGGAVYCCRDRIVTLQFYHFVAGL